MFSIFIYSFVQRITHVDIIRTEKSKWVRTKEVACLKKWSMGQVTAILGREKGVVDCRSDTDIGGHSEYSILKRSPVVA